MSSELQERAQRHQSDLSPQLVRALRYLLSNADEIAMSSMRALSVKAEVTAPTMLRLVRRLGYADWNELRDEIQARVRNRDEGPLTARARSLASRPGHEALRQIISEAMAMDERNLQRSWHAIMPEQLEVAVSALRAARRVCFLGRRSCYPVAFSMAYAFGTIRDNGQLMSDNGVGLSTPLIGLDHRDMLVSVGFAPYSAETVELTQQAVKAGVAVLAITDSPISPLAEHAAHLFVAANEGPALFQSIIAAQSISQALIALIAAADGAKAVAAIEQREAQLQVLGAYR
ncbi:MurR/RpiR family transcriptional regulator [Halodurantibacterium flavum]|uniref:MurR/RpiR family transcriptional regulator n=1 Tax=Halodurantibacterium flavum TaxID=1382802 RepID=A0ABW4S122_9RHOB